MKEDYIMQTYQDYNMLYGFPEVEFEKDYIVATYQVVANTRDAEKLAMAIADEQTTGTWTKVKYETKEKKRIFYSYFTLQSGFRN